MLCGRSDSMFRVLFAALLLLFMGFIAGQRTTMPKLLEPMLLRTKTTAHSKKTLGDIETYFHSISFPSSHPGHLFLLKWDASGSLDPLSWNLTISTNSRFPRWAKGVVPHMSHAEPSSYGTLALLLNSDEIQHFDWSIPPPVPLLAYTIPLTAQHDENFRLVPNPYDVKKGINRWCVKLARKTSLSFQERIEKIVWRGALHGSDERSGEPPRVKLLEIAENESNSHWLNAAQVHRSRKENWMDIPEMAEFRYQLDIGGVSGTTWGGLRWKMCSGSLVFKVDTWSKDWWHDLLEPWKHYVPVKEDLSDLYNRWEWAQNHPQEALEIAEAGNALCEENLSNKSIAATFHDVLMSLPPATEALVNEADAFLGGQREYDLLNGISCCKSEKADVHEMAMNIVLVNKKLGMYQHRRRYDGL